MKHTVCLLAVLALASVASAQHRAKEIVWKIEQNDLPGITLAWVTTLEKLPNGNIITGNCHGGEANNNPQLIEVSPDKKVVWQYHTWEHFGNAVTNSIILDVEGSIR